MPCESSLLFSSVRNGRANLHMSICVQLLSLAVSREESHEVIINETWTNEVMQWSLRIIKQRKSFIQQSCWWENCSFCNCSCEWPLFSGPGVQTKIFTSILAKSELGVVRKQFVTDWQWIWLPWMCSVTELYPTFSLQIAPIFPVSFKLLKKHDHFSSLLVLFEYTFYRTLTFTAPSSQPHGVIKNSSELCIMSLVLL